MFLSEVHHTRSASVEDVIASIKTNNNVALKGVIQESLGYDSSNLDVGLNTQLRRRLDLFASVVHIKTMEGLKTRHGQKLDFIVIREQVAPFRFWLLQILFRLKENILLSNMNLSKG